MKGRINVLKTVLLEVLIRGHIPGVVLNVWQAWDGLKEYTANILMNPLNGIMALSTISEILCYC